MVDLTNVSEIKQRIKDNYKRLNRLFQIHTKPTREMRDIQQETWKLKKQITKKTEAK